MQDVTESPVNGGAARADGAATDGRNGWIAVAATGIAAAIIAGTAFLAYSNTFAVPLLFDDFDWIANNVSIRQLWPIDAVLRPKAEGLGCRPLVNLSLAVNYAISGTDVWSYHATNLAIHILAGLTLFGLVRRTLLLPGVVEPLRPAAWAIALLTALIWTLHPLQTQAVTYIIQRCESLMGLCFLFALYALLRGATAKRSGVTWYGACVLAAFGAAGCKEVAAALPLVALLYDRAFLSATLREIVRKRSGVYVGLFATWGLTAWLLSTTPRESDNAILIGGQFNAWSYLLTEPGVIVRYLQLSFWPVGLCFDYGWPPAASTAAIAVPAAVVLVLLTLTGWALWRRPAIGFLGAWFFLILAPTSSFIPIDDAAAEHRMYLPLAAVAVGVAALAGGAALLLLQRRGPLSAVTPAASLVAAGACVVILGLLTYQRNAQYASEMSIWEDTAVKAPGNWRAQSNLGKAFLERKNYDAAVRHCTAAVELAPDNANALNMLGLVLCAQGDVAQAVTHLRRAVELRPGFAVALNSLAVALSRQGQSREALAHYRRAIELRPDYAEAHYNLGKLCWDSGDRDEALVHLRKAVELQIDRAEADYSLATALAREGDSEAAMTHYRRALRFDPAYAEAHNNLGGLLWQRGETAAAIDEFRAAAASRSDYLEAHYNLACVLLQDGQAAGAVEAATRAREITGGRSLPVLEVLAAAHASGGQFREAADTAERGLNLARRQGDQAAEARFRQQSATYRGLAAPH